MQAINCAYLIEKPDGPPTARRQIRIDRGYVHSVSAAPEAIERAFVMPALVNAHDHGRAVRTSSLGASGKPLESWLQYQALIPAVDPYLAAVVALSRAARGGVGALMMHLTRPQGLTDLPSEVAEIARAARDVGLRVGFAVSMRDQNPLVYGDSGPVLSMLSPHIRVEIERAIARPKLEPRDYITIVDEVAAAAAGPMFDVQFGPNGVQWCSEDLLGAIAEASHRSGRRIHMHLLETRYQRAWADRTYPDGMIKFLDALGVLSPRLTVAHCVWARPDELELLAARGVTIVVNTSSNLHLRSGIAPVAQMIKAGCRIALGIDGSALDDDDDALRELRLLYLIHAGNGFSVDMSYRQLLQTAFVNGRFSVTNSMDDGSILPSSPADFLVLDWNAIDDDGLVAEPDPLQLMLTRATARHIRELIVAGRSVVKDGKVNGVDAGAANLEVIERMRQSMADKAALMAALPELEQAIAKHFEPGAGCF